uniref:Glypican-3 n=1 Tax=Cynoglossus semilaevis TaxID=244447 RepID=A0A3P8WMR6_CYNSE
MAGGLVQLQLSEVFSLFPLPGGQVPNCQEVRTMFQALHPGSKWVPESPVSEAFDLVLRHGRNSTLTMLKSEFPSLGSGAQSSVGQLFLDMAHYILGSDSSVDHMVTTLYARLFPLAYRRLLGGSLSSVSEECVRGAWKDSGAFGPYPKLMMTRLSRSLLATRVFLQALNLGIEIINTTDHLRPGRDCSRALLRLWYCPYCQGMLGPPPPPGACSAGLEFTLPSHDLSSPLLLFSPPQVTGMCAHAPQRAARSVLAPPPPPQPPAASAVHTSQPSEFISNLRGFSSFYSGLGEALCSREPLAANDSLCWNGQEMTDKFNLRGDSLVVFQRVIAFNHFLFVPQLLRLVTLSEKRWRARAREADGRSDDVEGFHSGDCDDEDECTGVSGLGPPPRRKRLRVFSEMSLSIIIIFSNQTSAWTWTSTDHRRSVKTDPVLYHTVSVVCFFSSVYLSLICFG